MCNCANGHDEIWLTVPELVELIADGIDAALVLPAGATRDERRSAMRARFDEQRAAAAAAESEPKTRSQMREERAQRRFG